MRCMRVAVPVLFVLSFGSLVLSPLVAQENDVQIETVELTPNLHVLFGQGGNIGVSSGDDGVFLIDDQYAPLTDKIRAAVAELSDQPIRFVLNTHWHGDHTGGNENLGTAGALIVAHDNVHERMSTEQFMKRFDETVPPSPKAALPVVTFNDRITFRINGEVLRATHYPQAHTDGDSLIWFDTAHAVHMGDLYFNGLYPFIDVGSGGSADGVIAAVEDVLSRCDEKMRVIPGHGPVSNAKELKAYLEMLRGTYAAVTALVAEGKDLAAVVAAKPSAPWDEAWGKGYFSPEAYTGFLFDSATKE